MSAVMKNKHLDMNSVVLLSFSRINRKRRAIPKGSNQMTLEEAYQVPKKPKKVVIREEGENEDFSEVLEGFDTEEGFPIEPVKWEFDS